MQGTGEEGSEKDMKISRSTKNGVTCAYCGRHNDTNEGASDAHLNGEVDFWCAYCGKRSRMDVGVSIDRKPAPWHRPERVPPGYHRTAPMWKSTQKPRRR